MAETVAQRPVAKPVSVGKRHGILIEPTFLASVGAKFEIQPLGGIGPSCYPHFVADLEPERVGVSTMNAMAWLTIAIVFEVLGTTCMKLSMGFTKHGSSSLDGPSNPAVVEPANVTS